MDTLQETARPTKKTETEKEKQKRSGGARYGFAPTRPAAEQKNLVFFFWAFLGAGRITCFRTLGSIETRDPCDGGWLNGAERSDAQGGGVCQSIKPVKPVKPANVGECSSSRRPNAIAWLFLALPSRPLPVRAIPCATPREQSEIVLHQQAVTFTALLAAFLLPLPDPANIRANPGGNELCVQKPVRPIRRQKYSNLSLFCHQTRLLGTAASQSRSAAAVWW